MQTVENAGKYSKNIIKSNKVFILKISLLIYTKAVQWGNLCPEGICRYRQIWASVLMASLGKKCRTSNPSPKKLELKQLYPQGKSKAEVNLIYSPLYSPVSAQKIAFEVSRVEVLWETILKAIIARWILMWILNSKSRPLDA